jgi:hypothetical protein
MAKAGIDLRNFSLPTNYMNPDHARCVRIAPGVWDQCHYLKPLSPVLDISAVLTTLRNELDLPAPIETTWKQR